MSQRANVQSAIDQGHLSPRLWLYSNYHCNLACTYCLTESSPTSPARLLSKKQMLQLSKQAKILGFKSIGITGGEPFLRPDLEMIVAEIAKEMPVLILTNGTLFNQRRIERMKNMLLAEHSVSLQISLDSASAEQNDSLRGENNFNLVAAAVPRLIAKGFHVRVAGTIDEETPEMNEELKRLLDSWGIQEADQIIRPVVNRGRAVSTTMGVTAGIGQLSAELTITTSGAFWSPFGPTYNAGKLETDLLLVRRIEPLDIPVQALLTLFDQQPDLKSEPEGFV